MFEKEAEENANQFIKTHSESDDFINCKRETDNYNVILAQGYEIGFQKGAEFGYNKANEWHYPSKGEYPKDEKNVLCILGDFENDNLEVGYYSQKENEKERWRFSEFNTPDDGEDSWGVSAWKEIVLPKESE